MISLVKTVILMSIFVLLASAGGLCLDRRIKAYPAASVTAARPAVPITAAAAVAVFICAVTAASKPILAVTALTAASVTVLSSVTALEASLTASVAIISSVAVLEASLAASVTAFSSVTALEASLTASVAALSSVTALEASLTASVAIISSVAALEASLTASIAALSSVAVLEASLTASVTVLSSIASALEISLVPISVTIFTGRLIPVQICLPGSQTAVLVPLCRRRFCSCRRLRAIRRLGRLRYRALDLLLRILRTENGSQLLLRCLPIRLSRLWLLVFLLCCLWLRRRAALFRCF